MSCTCKSCGGTGRSTNMIRQQSCFLCGGSGSAPYQFSMYPASVTVEQGDCLYKIAKFIYGNGEKWPLIYLHNRDKISHPNHLMAKTVLSIPSVNFFRIRPYLVTVKSGDTLSLIAKKVFWKGKRSSDIYDANRYQLSDPNPHAVLTEGIVLIIP